MPSVDLGPDFFSALGLDWTRLCGGIKGGSAAGEDIRYTPEFDALSQARREEDDTEQGIWQVNAKKADWRAVVSLACDILSTRSKDLQVVVWLVQGLYQVHDLKGLAAGLTLLGRLTKTMWPLLWPRPDGDDLEPRLAPYYWVDSRLPADLMKISVSDVDQRGNPGFTYQQLVRARELDRIAGNRRKVFEAALAEGEVSLDTVQSGVARSATGFLIERWQDLRLVQEATRRLVANIDAAAGKDAPSFKELRRILDDLERLFAQALADRGALPSEVKPMPPDSKSDDKTDPAPAAPRNGSVGETGGGLPVIRDRRAAYVLLNHAAEWLLAHEPHSPAPFLIKRALSWENLSLGEVLSQLLAAGGNIDVTLKILGISTDRR